ncbi:MAG: sigma-70 family RNA polymerase sigma factor [Propionibacteriaceae bacterium]|jgi:RNA polymerase sigma factor (sigma-70 family)|nr:sigma-70 family RNA polymerase sigma factor [Propionibacteriaceae bacterium]
MGTSNGNADPMQGKDAVGLYLADIAKKPLLTAVEEIELAKRIEVGLYAEQLLKGELPPAEAAKHRLKVPPSELERLVEEGKEARAKFINGNLRLVVSVAKKYAHGQMPLLDIIQEGNAGLIRAVEKFDYTKGFKFSTYATWWVRQSIARGIAQQGRIVRLPVHIAEQISQVLSTRRMLEAKLDREATAEEIAEAIDRDPKYVMDMLRYSQEHVSLDAPIDDDGDTPLIDVFNNDATTSGSRTEDEVIDADVRENVEKLLEVLDERSADIVRRRYGLLDGRQAKLSDIGAEWGISSERVRQLERAAIAQLRLEDKLLATVKSS